MKRHFIWVLAVLVFGCFFMIYSISLAADEEWTKKADMPTARDVLSTSVVNDKIYAIGGENGPDLSTVEEYDPVKDTWTKKADMPTARQALNTSTVNGKIYAVGGITQNPWVTLSTVEEYDPVKDSWTKKADMPTKRFALSTCVINGKIYAIGGVSWNGQDWIPFSSVEEYDPVTDTWTKKTDMPAARGVLSSSVVNGQIYVIGGAIKIASAFSKVEIYDPIMDRWKAGTDMPTARRYLSTSAVNGKIYAIGGSTAVDACLNAVEEYTPEGWPFKQQSVFPQEKLATSWGEIKSKQ